MADDLRPAARSGTFTIGGDLPVHRLGFGAMRITGQGIWGPPEDHDEAIRVLRRALELGITLIDTADSYGPEVSERLIAEALYPYPPELVIATKAGFRRPGPNQWRRGRAARIPPGTGPWQPRSGFVSNGSTCSSCTVSIPRCPWRTRSER